MIDLALVGALKDKWTYNTFINTYPQYTTLCDKDGFKVWRAICLAKAIHGDKYDYSLWRHIANKHQELTTICPIHGEFTQTYRAHVTKGSGCKKCATDSIKMSIDVFRKKAQQVHGNEYLYNDTNLSEGLHSKVTITCAEHGEFLQAAYSHLAGHKCPKCANRKLLTIDEVRTQLSDRDVQVVSYTGNKNPMILLCPEHGEWSTYKTNVLGKGSGCPKCYQDTQASAAERSIAKYINSFGFSTEKYVMQDGKHIDIYIPELHLGFEYNGSYWHSSAHKDRLYHINKTIQAQKEGITLFHIWEYEYTTKKDIVLNTIKSKLGISASIYARKCTVDLSVSCEEAKLFTDNYHIQGHRPASKYIGLRYNSELVMLATFMNTRGASTHSCDTELIRLVSSTRVVGGASKLLSRYKNKNILSYARRDYSTGMVYEALGFELLATTPPNYKYIKGNNILSREKCMKHKLPSLLGEKIDMTKTEQEIMKDKGYFRVYDCGNLVYRKLSI